MAPLQLHFTPLREYEVHAISVYDEVSFLLVIDNLNTPSFHPRVMFETIEPSIPTDWVCNVFPSGPIALLLGPAFIARNQEAYNDMVDQRIAQVNALWQRVRERTASQPE